MKRVCKLLTIFGLMVGVANAEPQTQNLEPFLKSILKSHIEQQSVVSYLDVIDWKVGEFQNHKIEMAFGTGTMKKTVSGEEGDGVWLTATISLMGQNMEQKSLIDRKTGKILKLIVNGKEQSPSDTQQDIEILEQRKETVTVPAGTFDAMYIKAKVKSQGQEQIVQMWANPDAINIDGQIQMKAELMAGLEMTMKLTAFGTN